MFRLPILLLSLLPLASLATPPPQDPGELRLSIEAFLKRHTQSLPGKSSFNIGKIEANTNRPACPRLQTELAPNAKAYGKTTVLVRCDEGASWRLYVPVQIDVQSSYLASTRLIGQGQALTEADIAERTGNLAELPNNVLSDPKLVIGRVAAVPISAGQTLRADLLRQPWVIQAGQNVRVSIRGTGFEVTTEGRALASAAAGKSVQVRLNNGQLLTGVAQAGGWIEVGN